MPGGTNMLVTSLSRPGMSLEITDWVDPEKDMMIRHFDINGPADFFNYWSSFAAWNAGPGQYTDTDPTSAGYKTFFVEKDDLFINFQPKHHTRERGKQISIHSNYTPEELDLIFPEGGIFLAWGLIGKTNDKSIYGLCSSKVINKNQKHITILSQKLDPISEKQVSVIIAIAESASEAAVMIKEARSEGIVNLKEKAINFWKAVSERIHIPQQTDPVSKRVVRRSVLNLIQGQDREGGSIVASISRQPAYHFDWPRDGAFFDLTLDLAGFPEKVTHHHEFYKRTQYKKQFGFMPLRLANFQLPFYKPVGHWPGNMAADGTNGSVPKILPFEIDETALLVWDFWRHERALPESERAGYINEMKDTMALAADALLDYVDIKKGWTRPAVEDDNFPPDATLHGVSSVLTGLASACDAGPRWGFSKERTDRWCTAGRALREGVRGRIMFEETRGRAGWRGLSWSLWPAPVFDHYDEPGARIIKKALAESIRKKVDKEVPGFAYLGEEVFILALADKDKGEYRDLLERALKLLTHEVAFPGTDCYGEVTLWGDFAGTGKLVAQQRTSIPHIWNGVTVYLSALAIYEPERFDIMRPPAP